MTGEELLIQYAEQFGEAFPLFSFPNDEEEIIKTIKECLENGTPYEPKYDKDTLY